MKFRRLILATLVAAVGLAGTAEAQPTLTLRFPGFAGASFPSSGAVIVPAALPSPPEIWLEDALAEIQLSTVRVRLNESPMTPFIELNSLPRGLRIRVKIGASLNAAFNLRPDGENLLTVDVADETRVTYAARFYLRVDPKAAMPQSAPSHDTAGATVRAPDRVYPPVIRLTSDWPKQTTEKLLTLEAEVTDREGLRRIVIEVDGRDVEEIVLENEQPVRKQGGFVARGRLPGEVSGDARRISFAIPVRLTKEVTVVAVRAENTGGIRARADRAIEVKKP